MSIHDEHRKRLKNRFRTEGLDNFDPRHVLELLLFYSIPRKDTAPLVQELFDRFGTLTQVLEASVDELEQVKGIGEHTATLLALVTAINRYYMVMRSEKDSILNTMDMCGDYLVHRFHGRKNETVFLLCLDSKCKVLCCREVGEGSVNSANVPIRRIVEIALVAGASTVVLAHNHPSGIAVPSNEDIMTTKQLAAALETVDIQLADHIVVADDDYVSLAQSGYYCPGSGCVVI